MDFLVGNKSSFLFCSCNKKETIGVEIVQVKVQYPEKAIESIYSGQKSYTHTINSQGGHS